MLESALVTRIRHALEKRGAKLLKIHGTAFARVGTPDLIGCYRGRAFVIEVKRPGGSDGFYKHEPTPAQHYQLCQWQKAGALAGVARSVEDALAIIGLGWNGF